jgi:predicted esterase
MPHRMPPNGSKRRIALTLLATCSLTAACNASDNAQRSKPSRDAGDSSAELNSTAPHDLPRVQGTCPALDHSDDYDFGELRAHVYVSADARAAPAPGGPLIFYWNSAWLPQTTGPIEVLDALGQSAIDQVVAMGGMVVAPYSRRCSSCKTSGAQGWYLEDLDIADQIVACAIERAHIDVQHIHALGWSSGGFAASDQLLLRANYMASALTYSGGLSPAEPETNDKTHLGATLLTFGNPDYYVVGFRDQSRLFVEREAPRGRYIVSCDHGGPHEIDPLVAPHALRFLLDHPYTLAQEPYLSGIPDEFPSYCKHAGAPDDGTDAGQF